MELGSWIGLQFLDEGDNIICILFEFGFPVHESELPPDFPIILDVGNAQPIVQGCGLE